MTTRHIATHGRHRWTNVLQWVGAMENVRDTSEVEPLERRVRILGAAVKEMRHRPGDRAGTTAASSPAA